MNPDNLVKSIDDHLKLDEILDICSDFEKQIQAEQDELRLLAQKRLEEEYKYEEGSANVKEDSYQFGAISFYPSTPPLPARRGSSPLKSPTNGVPTLQWSPINTMSPNR